MKIINKFFYYFNELMVLLGKIMLLSMIVITCTQIFTRRVFNYSIRWSNEVPLILMIWFGFIAMSVGVKGNLHISIELFYNLFPKKMQKYVEKFGYLMVFVVGIFLAVWGYKLTAQTMSSTMSVTKMPRGFLYIVLPFTGVSIAYYSFLDLLGLDKNEIGGGK